MQIGQTKIDFNQGNIPAPLWYRRLTNAIVLSFLPIYVGFINILQMTDYKRSICAQIGIAIPIALKGFAFLIGNGQVYVPSNTEIDKKSDTVAKFVFWFIVGNSTIMTL